MDKAIETLFYPFAGGVLEPPKAADSVLFINARICAGLETVKSSSLTLQQYFKPYADSLRQKDFQISPDMPEKSAYDFVLIHMPKSKPETQYDLACAANILKQNATLLCAAGNHAGGTRLKGFLKELGFENIEELSKNKARVAWAQKPATLNEDIIRQWMEQGAEQSIDNGLLSIPGLFGWDKTDKGSEILTQYLPRDLNGRGADFGCGYGYLSDFLLQHNPDIEEITCIDADYRAVKIIEKNLEKYAQQKTFRWEDLTKPVTAMHNLDWIVMNPAFHEGKKADTGIGAGFIATAAKTLKPGGALYMVANKNLPYEKTLEENFSSMLKKFEGGRFKIFAAIK